LGEVRKLGVEDLSFGTGTFDSVGGVTTTRISGPIEIINITEPPYNAVGDGTTDDTAAFQAAIDDLPAYTSLTFDSYNVPDSSTKNTIYVPAGVYKISDTLLFTNKAPCTLVGVHPGYGSGGSILSWHGGTDEEMVKIDGGRAVSISYIQLLGRGVAGYGLYFDRSSSGYQRGHGIYKGITIRDCTLAGIQLSPGDATNLNQIDFVNFYDTNIVGCYDGVVSLNRNNLNISFYNLHVNVNSPMATISPRNAVRLIEGGVTIYGFFPTDDGFSDYTVYLENAYINIIGGYTEANWVIKSDQTAPRGSVVNSTIIGFNHYPSSSSNYAISWNQEERTLAITGGRIGKDIFEGSTSGGIVFNGTQFHNVPNWTGRTSFSSIVNGKVMRGTSGDGDEYSFNWFGATGSYWSEENTVVRFANNSIERDNFIYGISGGEAGILELDGDDIKFWGISSLPAGNNTNKNLSAFTNVLAVQDNGSYKCLKVGANSICWGNAVSPSDGTWARGDVFWDTTATAGAAPGSVCVTPGTPGTWKEMGDLDA
jgi:hypothetical protein